MGGDSVEVSEGTDPALPWKDGESDGDLNLRELKLFLKRDQITEAVLYIILAVSLAARVIFHSASTTLS